MKLKILARVEKNEFLKTNHRYASQKLAIRKISHKRNKIYVNKKYRKMVTIPFDW